MTLIEEQIQNEMNSWGVHRFENYGKNEVLRRGTLPFSQYVEKIKSYPAQSSRILEMIQWMKDSKLSSCNIAYLAIYASLDFFLKERLSSKRVFIHRLADSLREESRLYRLSKEHVISHVIVKERIGSLVERMKRFSLESQIEEPHKVLPLLAEWLLSGLIQFGFIVEESSTLSIGKGLQAFLQKNKEKDFHKSSLPVSLVRPKDWTSPFSGGYQTQLRLTIARQEYSYLKKHFQQGQIPQEYKAINQLQSTHFTLNPFIVSTLLQMDKEGLLLKFFEEQRKLPIKRFKSSRERFISKLASTLESIKKLQGKDFYMVWGLDHRGRKYTKGSLSFQRSDYIRSLFLFKREKKLGLEGSQALAIHGANMFGIKGEPHQKIAWHNLHLKQIKESACSPLDASWWRDADSPFQFLAFCKEWLRFEKEGFEMLSQLPIQIDGSCNALQHYAGLFKDESLATLSNLKGDIYHDLYTEFARKLYKQVIFDVNNSVLDSFYWKKYPLNRSEIKHLFMILSYGGSEYGLKEYLIHLWFQKPPDPRYRGAYKKPIGYMLQKLQDFYKKELPSLQRYNQFITDAAKERIQQGEKIQWKGVTGITICCETIQTSKSLTHWQKEHKVSYQAEERSRTSKNIRSVAPNLIHSLDAAHMTLTVLRAKRKGIQIIGIHDGFVTHGGDIDSLKKIVKKIYVEIYSKDVLQEFLKDLNYQKSTPFGKWECQEALHSEFAFT